LRNFPILVLDEPTAALDSHAEAEIQSAIDSLEEGRTVICIAHRLSTLANMDEIIVLDHGRIVERGTFEELLKAKGHFAKMAEQQRLTASSTPSRPQQLRLCPASFFQRLSPRRQV